VTTELLSEPLVIDFRLPATATVGLHGFGRPEEWGCWTLQETAHVLILRRIPKRVTLSVAAHTRNELRGKPVVFELNGQRQTATFVQDTRTVELLYDQVAGDAAILRIQTPGLFSPSNGDTRRMGIGAVQLSIAPTSAL
jgi:hypothetical protein